MLHRTRKFADKVIRRIISVVPTRSLEGWEKRHEKKVIESVEKLVPHVPEEGFFLDIGCNIGSFSRHLRARRPKARGILFEPVQEYAAIAKDRFADDGGIEVLNIGLGNENADKTIYKPNFNYGGNSLVTEIMFDQRPNAAVPQGTQFEEETVTIRHVSDWLDERGIVEVDVVKMDTEGYDWAVMEGLLPWLQRTGQRPVLFIEVFTAEWHPLADRQAAAFESFYELGYGRVDIESLISGICGDALLIPVPGAASAGGPVSRAN